MIQLLLALFMTITLSIESTKIIKNGHLNISTRPVNTETVYANIHYKLKTKWYVPIPDQEGDLGQELPVEFTNETGYQRLERESRIVYKDVYLDYLGRANVNNYSNCYKIKVTKTDNTWWAVAYYHPSIQSTGWARLELTYNNIPALGTYTIRANLK